AETVIRVGQEADATITAPPVLERQTSGHQASVPDGGLGAGYQWQIENGWITSESNIREVVFAVDEPGIATLTAAVTSPTGCVTTETHEVIVGRRVSIDPGSGITYTPVVIKSASVGESPDVSFGGVPAVRVQQITPSILTAITPDPAGALIDGTHTIYNTTYDHVTLLVNESGYEPGTGTFSYREQAPVVIRSIEPSSAPLGGGTEIVIEGRGFSPDAIVTIDTEELITTWVSPGRLTAITNAHPAGRESVTVRSGGGTYGYQPGYRFYDPSFRIVDISPKAGPTSGGTALTVTGSGFTEGMTLKIASLDVVDLQVVSSELLTAKTAPYPSYSAVGDVVASNGTITSILEDAFLYHPDTVRIDSITPAFGPLDGGTEVTIRGSGFTESSRVVFRKSVSSQAIEPLLTTFVDATELRVVTPPGAPGLAHVGISSFLALYAFRYEDVPAVLTVSPSEGKPSGGTEVWIEGRALPQDATVSFGGVAATSVTWIDPTHVRAVTPPHTPGVVEVTVGSAGGTNVFGSARYTYLECDVKPSVQVSGAATICPGESATVSIELTGEPPWTITWSDGFVQSEILTTSAIRTVTPLETTIYSAIDVVDAFCRGSSSGSATITVKDAPAADITAPTRFEPESTGNVVSVPDGGTGTTYEWTVANGTITEGVGTREITISVGTASPATISVTVTRDGCSTTSTRSIPVTEAVAGDVNGDLTVSVADIFYLINYLFAGGPAPIGPGDANGDGAVTVADIFYLINYLFAGGPAPV
ncbi:MAG: IPT/TIG domain-containing protein, partial [Acidobacteria bacterium]|nr:IPT/TIG domain-containing protein [Acidobacteriota bacterium]